MIEDKTCEVGLLTHKQQVHIYDEVNYLCDLNMDLICLITQFDH